MAKREYIANINMNLSNATVAGRVMSVRKMKNYSFCDIADASGKIQLIIVASKNLPTPEVADIILAAGPVVTTKSGQTSIECYRLETLSKGSKAVLNAIKAVSAVGGDINGPRSLSLLVNDDLKNMVRARSIFIDTVRTHFKNGGFLDVDTPIMSYSRFAGTADVFQTRSRTMEKDLYLRGTLEDYLKQLVVAGFEKVFQIGDCFRNESPALIEFTMLEATWAYASSEQMLHFVQELITTVCNQLPDELVDQEAKKEFAKKIQTVTFWDTLESYFKVDIRTLDYEEVQALAEKEGYALHDSPQLDYELAKFGYEVIKRKLANTFEAPTFVGRFPACISPLAKEIQDGSGEADRGYGFFRGQRLFEVVAEASDYHEQLEKFNAQDTRGHQKVETFKHDDLLTALSYGCPPMAGLGFNINRVLAVLLNVTRTSDVVAFPLTKAALPL